MPSNPPCAESTVPTDEQGLLALDAATGAVRWRVPVLPSVPASSPQADTLDNTSLWLKAADAQTAVLGTVTDVPGSFHWSSPSTVVIDVATGTVRWHTASRYHRAALLGAAGGVALLWDSTTGTAPNTDPLVANPKANGRYEMVDVRTGTVRASMAAYTATTLNDDNVPCADQEPPDPTLLACMVVPHSSAGSAQPERLWTVLDRAGKTLARSGGTVLALSDGYAVVQTGRYSTDYGVYHLRH